MVQEFGLRRLLLAVEEPSVRALIRRILDGWPLEVIEARTTREAVRKMHVRHPHVVLLDESWEHDIDPSAYPGVAVAILTFDRFAAPRRADPFVQRIVLPFTPDALTSTLKRICRLRDV